MAHLYQVTEDFICDEANKAHTVYGIQAVNPAGYVVKRCPDIFFEEKPAKRLAALCNREQPDIVHLDDVVADALAERYTCR